MSFDKREAILQRMLAILQAVADTFTTDAPFVFRNRGEIPIEKMPALVLLDGREAIAVSAAGKGGILVPTIFTLSPQVFAVLKPTPDASNEGIGEALSAYRVKLLKAFSTDEELFGLLGSNGELQYLSGDTDMQTGSTMLGQMQLALSLNYVLNPGDL
jgi:hypothetical protein